MHKLPPLAGWPTQTSLVQEKESPHPKSELKKKRTVARRQKKGTLKQEHSHD